MTKGRNRERIENLVLALLFTAPGIPLLFHNALNTDELCTVNWCRLGWAELFDTLVQDVHPPLYYIVTKAVLDLTGESLSAARAVSLVCVFLFLYVCGRFLKDQFGGRSRLLFLLFVCTLPCMTQKSTEIRMYSMATCFVLLGAVRLYLLLKKPCRKNWLWFILFGLLAAYTQYFAIAVMIFLYLSVLLYFFMKKDWKNTGNFFFYGLLTVAGYLPWLGIAVRQITSVNGGYWITLPDSRLSVLRDLLYGPMPYTEKIFLMLLVLITVGGFLLLVIKKDMESYFICTCAAPLWGILIIGTWYGEHVRPLLVSRYLIMALCLVVLGGGSICAEYVNRYVAFLLCLFFVLSGSISYSTHYKSFAASPANETIRFTQERVNGETVIVGMDGADNLVSRIGYYLPDSDWIHYKKADLVRDDYDEVWYFDVLGNLDISALQAAGIQVEDFGRRGYGYEEFRLYRISKKALTTLRNGGKNEGTAISV